MDPETGHVRAMIGGRDFGESSFNRAVQAKRQPGSAFKPFVYAAALEAGFTPATMIDRLNEPIETLQGDWTPEDEHSDAESMSLRAALRTSSNRAAVRLLQEVGIPSTVQYAKTLGVGDVPSVPSLALGSGEVTLQAMTAAYAAFANKGRVPQPMVIRRVEDRDGRVLFTAEEQSTQAVSEATAYLMASMLADVINAGTGARARALGFALPAAGKTGTTNEYKDAWFVGFTPMLVTGVWVGFDEPHTIMPNGFASDIAVPMWASFMKAATRGNKPGWLSPPAGITSATVCRLVGANRDRGVRTRRGDRRQGRAGDALDGLQRVVCEGHRAEPAVRFAPDARLLRCRGGGVQRRRQAGAAAPGRHWSAGHSARCGRGPATGRGRGGCPSARAAQEARLLGPLLRPPRQGRGQVGA